MQPARRISGVVFVDDSSDKTPRIIEKVIKIHTLS
jgi:hypothetical protein